MCQKKQALFEEKFSKTIGKLKELWESLKSLGITNKMVNSNFKAIGENDTPQSHAFNLQNFKNFLF